MSQRREELKKLVTFDTQLHDDKTVLRFRLYFNDPAIAYKASDVEKWFADKVGVKRYGNNSIELSLRFKEEKSFVSLAEILSILADKGYTLTDEAFTKLQSASKEAQSKLPAIAKGSAIDPYLLLFKGLNEYFDPSAKPAKKPDVVKQTEAKTTKNDKKPVVEPANKASGVKPSEPKPTKNDKKPVVEPAKKTNVAKSSESKTTKNDKKPVSAKPSQQTQVPPSSDASKKSTIPEEKPPANIKKKRHVTFINVFKANNGVYIGIKDDLQELTLDQIKKWFNSYEGFEIGEYQDQTFIIELVDVDPIPAKSINLVNALDRLQRHQVHISKTMLAKLLEGQYPQDSFVFGGFAEYLSTATASHTKKKKSELKPDTKIYAKGQTKILHNVTFEMKPHTENLSLSFPLPKGTNNDIVSTWFKGRVRFQLVGENIIIYLGESVDGKEIMSISDVLNRLQKHGLALTDDSLVDLQNVYRDNKSVNRKNSGKTQKTQHVHQLFKGLEKLFPDDVAYLKPHIFTAEEIKNAEPIPETIPLKDLNPNELSDPTDPKTAKTKLKLAKITEIITLEELEELKGYSHHNLVSIEKWLSGVEEKYSLNELFDLLLQHAANMKDESTYAFFVGRKICNINNPNIMYFAISRGKTKKEIQTLLDLGFDVNGVSFQSTLPERANTHIFTAYEHSSLEMVQMLLEAGANPHQLNEKGYSLIELAEKNEDEALTALLEPYKEKELSEPKPKHSAEHRTVQDVVEHILYSDIADEVVDRDKAMWDAMVDRWTAFSAPPNFNANIAKSMLSFRNIYLSKIGHVNIQPQLDVNNLTVEVKLALQNMIAYAGKLWNECSETSSNSKKDQLGSKMETLGEFITEILHQKTLSVESIQKAYNTFERNDENTGTGLYRLYTFFNGMRYTDKNKKSRLIKSTMGELGYQLMEALKREAENVADEDVDNSDLSNNSLSG